MVKAKPRAGGAKVSAPADEPAPAKQDTTAAERKKLMAEDEALRAAQARMAGIARTMILNKDLSTLSEDQRIILYEKTCESLGLNPLTRPFEYVFFRHQEEQDGTRKWAGILQLYATKNCTDQLRSIYKLSAHVTQREPVGGVFVAVATVSGPSGRSDESLGAVPIAKLNGNQLANAMMKAECVPLDSEILTRDGWARHDEVVVGQEVLAYDPASDRCIWTPLRLVTRHKDQPLVRLISGGEQFDVRCTPDHSWAVSKKEYAPDYRGGGKRGPRGPYANRGPDRYLVKACDLKTHERIVLSAANESDESLLSPAEAAVLGWAVTDGTIQRRGSFVRIGICQNKTENFLEIRNVAKRVVGSDVHEVVTPAGQRTFPMSGRTYETKAQHWWYLPSAIGRSILSNGGYQDRYDLPRIATRLSPAARRAMLQAFMLAEGDARQIFANGDRHILDTFQILAALEGLTTGRETRRDPIWTQRLKKARHVACRFLRHENAGRADVWCPTTDYGTWVMRQNGRVMITGNTKAKRRATLSFCGLSYLDETEIETVAGARVVDSTGETVGHVRSIEGQPDGDGGGHGDSRHAPESDQPGQLTAQARALRDAKAKKLPAPPPELWNSRGGLKSSEWLPWFIKTQASLPEARRADFSGEWRKAIDAVLGAGGESAEQLKAALRPPEQAAPAEDDPNYYAG